MSQVALLGTLAMKAHEDLFSHDPFWRAEREFVAAMKRDDIPAMQAAMRRQKEAICASWFNTDQDYCH